MPLIEYINKFYRGNQASFARLTGVQPAQVTQWINKGFIVVNHTLYSPRRKVTVSFKPSFASLSCFRY
nr:hypothetical protein [Escherichia coli]